MLTVLPDHCWIGPASIRIQGRTWRRYKLAYVKLYGPVPKGYELAHSCHNGPRDRGTGCWNPHHVRPLTHEENCEETLKERLLRTHCPAGHPYSGKNLRIHPNGAQVCRECQAAASRRYRAKRRT